MIHNLSVCLFTLFLIISGAAKADANKNDPISVPQGMLVAPGLPDYYTDAISVAGSLKYDDKSGKLKGVPVAFQVWPPEGAPVDLQVMFVLEKSGEKFIGPTHLSLCEVPREPVDICDAYGNCRSTGKQSVPTILCNFVRIRRLEGLIRLAHNNEFLNSMIASDKSFMSTLEKLDTDYENLINSVPGAQVDDNHMVDHLSWVLLFILSHERYHIMNPQKMPLAPSLVSKDAAGYLDRELIQDTERLKACRTYEEFKRQGWDIYKKSAVHKLADEAYSTAPETELVVKQSRAIWQYEIDADTYATQSVREAMLVLANSGQAEDEYLVDLRDYYVEALSFLALSDWYDRMRSLQIYPCGEFAGQNYLLSRCLCARRDHYKSVGVFFEQTHPPLYLRLARALTGMSGIPLFDKPSERSRNLLLIMNGLLDSAGKLAMMRCLYDTFGRFVKEDGKIFTDFSALEGFREDDLNGFPGAPAGAMGKVMEECIGLDHSPKSSPAKD